MEEPNASKISRTLNEFGPRSSVMDSTGFSIVKIAFVTIVMSGLINFSTPKLDKGP